MRYLEEKADIVIAEYIANKKLHSYDDIAHGRRFYGAYHKKDIQHGNIVLMLSVDGAQLFRNKQSDCWFIIWIVLNLSPDLRYKKRYIIRVHTAIYEYEGWYK